jgi:hypothetical protein
MSTPGLDIFKKDARGNPIWVDAVGDLETARVRVAQFAAALPGEYFVFDQRTNKVMRANVEQVEGS